MEIFLEKTGETKKIEFSGKKKIIEILNELNISNSSIILIKNDEITLEDSFVENKDELKILSVVSGG